MTIKKDMDKFWGNYKRDLDNTLSSLNFYYEVMEDLAVNLDKVLTEANQKIASFNRLYAGGVPFDDDEDDSGISEWPNGPCDEPEE